MMSLHVYVQVTRRLDFSKGFVLRIVHVHVHVIYKCIVKHEGSSTAVLKVRLDSLLYLYVHTICVCFSSGSPQLDTAAGIEQTDIDDVQSLQFMQWTIPQFCMAVMDKLLPCLKSPDEEFIMNSLALLHQVAALLRESVSASTLWDDVSAPARELVRIWGIVAMLVMLILI